MIETEECTPQLRWQARIVNMNNGSSNIGIERALQQAYRVIVRDDDHKAMGSRIEWRDVPTEPPVDIPTPRVDKSNS